MNWSNQTPKHSCPDNAIQPIIRMCCWAVIVTRNRPRSKSIYYRAYMHKLKRVVKGMTTLPEKFLGHNASRYLKHGFFKKIRIFIMAHL